MHCICTTYVYLPLFLKLLYPLLPALQPTKEYYKSKAIWIDISSANCLPIINKYIIIILCMGDVLVPLIYNELMIL